jgi:hypothetical protein
MFGELPKERRNQADQAQQKPLMRWLPQDFGRKQKRWHAKFPIRTIRRRH